MKPLTQARQMRMAASIERVRKQIRWKHDSSALNHLKKRKMRGHLSETATLEKYEQIISQVLQDRSAQVYNYWYGRVPYITIVAIIHDKHWLVMFSTSGILETAFVVDRPDYYLSKPGFERIGLLSEVDNAL